MCIDVTMSMLSWQDSGRDLCHGVKHSAESHCGKVVPKNLKMYAWMVSKSFFGRFLS